MFFIVLLLLVFFSKHFNIVMQASNTVALVNLVLIALVYSNAIDSLFRYRVLALARRVLVGMSYVPLLLPSLLLAGF
ncbi:MAG: hypothetical protein OEY38_22895 [Gammaproteobacteria bacterium]|nr:hypothetical protein [Gammaproteobacteria bacterium]